MPKLFTSFILWVVSAELKSDLRPMNFTVVLYNLIRYKGFLKNLSKQLYLMAATNDIYGNVGYSPILSFLFDKKDGYPFGVEGEKITSALGKKWVTGKLSFLGLGMVGLLNILDNDHCWKYIEGPDAEYYYDNFSRPLDPPMLNIIVVIFGIILIRAIKIAAIVMAYLYLKSHLHISWK